MPVVVDRYRRHTYRLRSMQGLPTIRAYDAGPRFYEAFMEYLDKNGSWWFCFIVTSRWIGFRLDTIAAIMLTAGALLAMAVHNKVRTIPCLSFLDQGYSQAVLCTGCLCRALKHEAL